MKTDLFNYDLPSELIAQHPPERRELARMLVLHRDSGIIEHKHITDIVDYLRAPDVLVLNNTKVIPARVFGNKAASGGKVELLLLDEKTPGEWNVLMKTSRRPKVGDALILCSGKAKAIMLEDTAYAEELTKYLLGRGYRETGFMRVCKAHSLCVGQ